MIVQWLNYTGKDDKWVRQNFPIAFTSDDSFSVITTSKKLNASGAASYAYCGTGNSTTKNQVEFFAGPNAGGRYIFAIGY